MFSTSSDAKQFKNQIRRLLDLTSGQSLVKATTGGALIIEGQTKINAPVDTGTLRNSVHHEVVSAQKTEVEVDVGPDTEYDYFVELGTVFQPAQPYLRPAFDNKRAQAIKTFGGIIASELTKLR